MDFEITSHFFPSVYVSVYDNLLDVKFATFEYSIYAEGQLVSYRTLGLFPDSVGDPSDPGQPLHTGHLLTHTLEM